MLRVRWLGRVPYAEADELQRALLERAADDYLLLLEHPHVYTLGKSADPAHVLVPPASVGADLVRADRGVEAERDDGYTGVWVGGEKIAAIGVRVSRGRTRHGFALNVDPDLSMFGHIVPCGIADRGVTSLAARLGSAPDMHDVVDTVTARFTEHFPYADVERQDVVWRERASDLSAFSRAGKEGGAAVRRFPDDCDGRAETQVGDPSRASGAATAAL